MGGGVKLETETSQLGFELHFPMVGHLAFSVCGEGSLNQ
jgi:hypothetical protein